MTFRLTRDRTFAIKLRARALPGETLDLAELATATCEADLKLAVDGKPPLPDPPAEGSPRRGFVWF